MYSPTFDIALVNHDRLFSQSLAYTLGLYTFSGNIKIFSYPEEFNQSGFCPAIMITDILQFQLSVTDVLLLKLPGHKPTRLIVLLSDSVTLSRLNAVQEKAAGIVAKSSGVAVLIEAIQTVIEGSNYLDTSIPA